MKKILIIVSLLAVAASAGASISLNLNPGGSGVVARSEVVGMNGVQADSWVNINTNAVTSLDIDGAGGSATLSFVSAYNFEATPVGSGFQDGSQNYRVRVHLSCRPLLHEHTQLAQVHLSRLNDYKLNIFEIV